VKPRVQTPVPPKKQTKQKNCWAPVAHTCNPSYSGGRYEEDRGSKPSRQIVHETLSRKKKINKRTVAVV
jgi:hypothetical protein